MLVPVAIAVVVRAVCASVTVCLSLCRAPAGRACHGCAHEQSKQSNRHTDR